MNGKKPKAAKKKAAKKSGCAWDRKTPEFVSVGSIEASSGGWSRVELFARFSDQAVARDSVVRAESAADRLPYVEGRLRDAEHYKEEFRAERDEARAERDLTAAVLVAVLVALALYALLA